MLAYPGHEPDWTAADRAAWRTFLAGPTGQRLLARGRAVQYDTAARACQEVLHTPHAAGVAEGFRQCLDWLENLTRVSRALDTPATDGANSPPLDTQLPGEAALRELMSP